MRAVTYRRYGSPDVLDLVEVAKPEPGPNEVVVKVHAASVNPLDWHFMRGSPVVVRLITGPFRPKNGRPGVDLAGVVDAVGPNVTGFRSGDEVFGAARGTAAEYVSARPDRLVGKPANLTFEQAAAVPVAALTALQGLRDKGRVQPGQQVLVIGASGGVGTFAVQIAKALGAEVTGVCSTGNVEMVASIGADRVVDYTQQDYATGEARYDVVLDCIGDRSLSDYRRIMNARGVHVGVGGSAGTLGILLDFLTVMVVSPFVSQRFVSFIATLNGKDLGALAAGHARGKVVVTTGASVGAQPRS